MTGPSSPRRKQLSCKVSTPRLSPSKYSLFALVTGVLE